MQQELTQDHLTQDQVPAQERYFWSIFQIGFASYIGGPVAGTYLLGRNYKNAELPGTAKKCYMWGIIVTAMLIIAALLIPEDLLVKIPSTLVPLAYATGIITLAQYQKKMIEEEFGKKNKRYSFFRCLGLSFAFLLIQMPLLFLIGFLFGMLVE